MATEIKKVGVFGSVANTVKGGSLALEILTLDLVEAATLSLWKIQMAAEEEVRESKPESTWAIERNLAIATARSTFK